MPNPYFRFKQFTVYHDLCAMKVGIDGVLLGAWAPVLKSEQNILDIGTGSGLIALMLAQRTEAYIDAIDTDAGAVKQAQINVNASKWNDRIEVYHQSLEVYAAKSTRKYDLIVSNPPFFVSSLKTPDQARAMARHANSQTHQQWLSYAAQMVKKTGRICFILPVNEGLKCMEHAYESGLFCYQSVYIHPKPGAVAKRLLLEFGFLEREVQVSTLTVESENRHQYSNEFTALVKDFYLKL
ncbi:MAG TPA: methyltransferase [Paludibacter sp.]|nr:methyltransferase [Paludibacter sp.]